MSWGSFRSEVASIAWGESSATRQLDEGFGAVIRYRPGAAELRDVADGLEALADALDARTPDGARPAASMRTVIDHYRGLADKAPIYKATADDSFAARVAHIRWSYLCLNSGVTEAFSLLALEPSTAQLRLAARHLDAMVAALAEAGDGAKIARVASAVARHYYALAGEMEPSVGQPAAASSAGSSSPFAAPGELTPVD
jgi:hypothetical protein